MKEELTINGFQNEIIIAKYLNNKKVKEVNPIFKDLITKLYRNIDEESIIKSEIDYTKKKYDLIIKIDDVIKRISIKKGINNSVHVEGISSFIHFLIDSGIEKNVIEEYLKYHYADGTTNGTGEKRLSGEEYKEQNQDKIDYINSKINTPYMLDRAINRFVLQGKNSGIKIDGIIYGTVNDFFFLTKSEIKDIIMSQINLKSSGVHFGPLFCQPMTRNLNNNPKYESKRFCIQIKWYSLHDDIIKYLYKNNVIKM